MSKKDAKIRQSERIIDINFCLFSGGGINFQISNLSETAAHHPTWLNTYNVVVEGSRR